MARGMGLTGGSLGDGPYWVFLGLSKPLEVMREGMMGVMGLTGPSKAFLSLWCCWRVRDIKC